MSDEFHPATLPHEKTAATPPLDRMSKTGKTFGDSAEQPHAPHGLPSEGSDMSGMLPNVNRKTEGENEAEVLKDKARAVQRKPDYERPEEEKAEAAKKRREKDEKERQDERVDREIGDTRRRRKERNEKERGSPHGASEETGHGEGEGSTLVSASQKIHWAPLNVPLPRRLQTTAVLWHTLAMSIFFSLFWFTLAIPLSWPIIIPYLIYVLLFARNHLDGTVPYKRSEFLRNLPLWRLYAEYFPIRLHRTAQLDPSKNYIFAYHPHGIISHGAFGNFATEATGFSQLFPGIKNTLLTLDTNFNIPFYREYLLSMGLASVSRESCEALLRGDGAPKKYIRSRANPPAKQETESEGGRAITIVIGGAQESLEAQPGTMKLLCKKRRGFLKLAIREGAGVVPVLSFGENDLYEQVRPNPGSFIQKLQLATKKSLGFTVPLLHARGVFNYDVGLMPYRRTVNTVVGKPLFPKQGSEEPTAEEVEVFQRRYMEELKRLWDEWKDVFAKGRLPGMDGELKIVE